MMYTPRGRYCSSQWIKQQRFIFFVLGVTASVVASALGIFIA